MENNDWLNILYLMVILAFVISGIFARKDISLQKVIKYLSIWIGIAVFIVILYSMRYNFSDFKDRIIGELNPSHIKSNQLGQIVINRSFDKHFYANIKINGVKIKFMIDTGATDIVLSISDAKKIGLDLNDLVFNKPYQTANGISYGASAILSNVEFGQLQLKNVRASVNNANMGTSLLGMTFLNKFKRYEIYRDQLILTP